MNEQLLNELNHGLLSLTNLVGLIYTFAKKEEDHGSMENFFNIEYERIKDLRLIEDELGELVRDSEGNPTYEEVEIVSEEEQTRDKLKKFSDHVGIVSSEGLIELFNKDTKSEAKTKEDCQILLMDIRNKMLPVLQMDSIITYLKDNSVSENTVNEIENLKNTELGKIKNFLLME